MTFWEFVDKHFDQLLRAGGLVLAFAFIFVFAWIAVRSEK